jgi:pectate lyase
MKTVIEFAENVLQYGRDRYRAEPTPLFADGINVFTGEHLRWLTPGEPPAVVSNLACQQNLFRTLVALTGLTGDERYRDAAKAAIRYHFDHLADSSGLLHWGGHCFIDLATLEVRGTGPAEPIHELKNALPFYELMFEVNPGATARFINAFWNAHVYDWDELHTGRHGQYGLAVGDIWGHEPVNKPPLRESTGLSFINTGNDLIYAAAVLYQFTGDPRTLQWSKHLAAQYVAARHPETGLGAYQFTQPLKRMDTDDDRITLSFYGDRAKRQFGPEFGAIALEANVLFDGNASSSRAIYCANALIQLQLAQAIGGAADCFLEWTRSGLRSFARYAYVPETNEIKPMFSDGKDLTGVVFQRDGFYGKAGRVLQRKPADCRFLLSYARGFLHTADEELWNTARSIGIGNGLGDLGSVPGRNPDLNHETDCHDARALFALLDIYRATSEGSYLALAERIGANIEGAYCHHGYFTRGPRHSYAQFDAIEPLALLALEAVREGKPDRVPVFLDGKGFIDGNYQFPEGGSARIKDDYLYELRQPEPLHQS